MCEQTWSEGDGELVELARRARDKAYCPYSRYRVGAALRWADGRCFDGANIENASYGLTLCAERTAVVKALTADPPTPVGHLETVVVAVDAERAASPCGACRQVLAEVGRPDTRVLLVDGLGRVREMALGELLPLAFGAPDLDGAAAGAP